MERRDFKGNPWDEVLTQWVHDSEDIKSYNNYGSVELRKHLPDGMTLTISKLQAIDEEGEPYSEIRFQVALEFTDKFLSTVSDATFFKNLQGRCFGRVFPYRKDAYRFATAELGHWAWKENRRKKGFTH